MSKATLTTSHLCHECRVEEVAAPYFVWRSSGFKVDFASVKGGDVVFDPASTSGDFCTPDADAFLKSHMNLVTGTRAIGQFNDEELKKYDAIFIPGGHGIMFDGPESKDLKKAVETMWNSGKIVAAVCHGPAGLLSVHDSSGQSILKGRRCCGFTNSEEKAVGKNEVVPYSLEDRMKSLGGNFVCGPDWGSYIVEDGKLLTGQNPQSSRALAEAVAKAISPGIEPQHGKGEGFHKRGHPLTREHHHDHADDHPGHGKRHDVSDHPQAHMHEWQQPLRQTTHTGTGSNVRSERPDRSYNA